MTTETVIKKTIGWIFLLLGIIILAYIAFTTINYFTGTYPFPEIFTSAPEVVSPTSTDSLNSLMESMLSNQLGSFVSKDSITLLFNMTAWSLFAFFMIYLGGKVFELGLKIMKD